MANASRPSVSTHVGSSLRVDPRIVLASQILELSQVDLISALETELAENPALEKLDELDLPVTMEDILRVVAPEQLKPTSDNHELWRSLPKDSEGDLDWLDFTPSHNNLSDHLIAQLVINLPPHLHSLATYLVGSINERGYLTCTPEEAALDCEIPVEDALEGIRLLKECDPPGVGASDLRECLLLQLRKAISSEEKLARSFLKNDWEALVQRNSAVLRKKYGVDESAISAAFAVITSLNPFPAEHFVTSRVRGQERPTVAKPDLILSRDETGWCIEVPGPPIHSLRVAPAFSLAASSSRENAEDQRHAASYVTRANRFIDALTHRRQTLTAIGKYLVETQAGFISTGDYRFLGSLTRAKLASALSQHESTISRATSGKYVQISTGEIVAFDVFFKPALRIQKLIEDILATENPDNPLSDESIARILKDQGVQVARRTVNKYRDRTRLLSSRHRKIA